MLYRIYTVTIRNFFTLVIFYTGIALGPEREYKNKSYNNNMPCTSSLHPVLATFQVP